MRIGISACLLGDKVRFDGQHKRDPWLNEELAPYVEWVPVCPELEAGLGVPRESVRLVRSDKDDVRMVGTRSERDVTALLRRVAVKRVTELAKRELDGFVLKSDSPSCGMERVKLYESARPSSTARRIGVGLFAAELARQLPHLPREEEGRLHDARLRDNFVERVFAHGRLRALWASPWRMRDLVAFHTAEKLALLAHSTTGYRALGRLVATGARLARAELRERYHAGFMEVLAKLATPGRHANVLEHMLGHLGALDSCDRRELSDLIGEHRRGLVPLVVPITLLRHHVRRLDVPYLAGQSYLAPHPRELMLRNHV